MKVSQAMNIRSLFTLSCLALLMVVGILTVPVAAQRRLSATTSILAPTNESATLTQCRNGATGTDPCAGNNWVTGNVGAQNSQFSEDEYLPYRMEFGGLLTTGHVYTLVLAYDTVNSGAHAIDYLGTYNTKTINPRPNTVVLRAGVDPCSDINGCVGPVTTIAITGDPNVSGQTNPNTGMPVFQPNNQVFTMWGGNLLSFSYGSLTTDNNGNTEQQVILTFTASIPNPVLSWSGHVGWVGDWGVGNSAGGISGSPYHMRLKSLDGQGGNQDRSLSADAVDATGAVFVNKVVVDTFTIGGCAGTAVFAWPFVASASFGTTSFNLVDNNPNPNHLCSDAATPSTPQAGQTVTSFATTGDNGVNNITVTECTTTNAATGCAGTSYPSGSGYSLSNVNCVESGIQDSTKNSLLPTATIRVQIGEVVTCTFTNTQQQPSAAMVTVSGRVLSPDGRGVRGALVSMTDSAGIKRTVTTSSFGTYTFTDVEAGQSYVMGVSSKLYRFGTRLVTVEDTLAGVDFVGQE